MAVKHVQGASVAFENLYSRQGESATVNGQPSGLKTQFNQQRMPGDWLALDSHQGWSFFFANGIPITEGGLFDHYLAGTELQMIYQDNAEGELTLGFAGTHLPKAIFELLKTAPKLPKQVNELGTALVFYEQQGREGALTQYDAAVNRIMQGYTQDKATLINAFLHDMQRMDYTGMPKSTLHSIMRNALQRSVAIPQEPLDHSKILSAILAETHQRNARMKQLRFATIPINLWFPHSLKEAPERFFAQQEQGIKVQTSAW